MKNKTLSLCMIVKDEELFLDKCISSVKDIVNEIIIVDTGSKDQTISIAEKYTSKIYNFQWKDNFSEARNFSISMATSDWILLLDGDEILDPESVKVLINFINTTSYDGCHFPIYSYTDETYHNYTIHDAFRLLKNNNQYHFEGKIHEQIVRIDKNNTLCNFTKENIILHHYGYLAEVVKSKNKRNRNIPILLKELEDNPNNSFNLFNLGNEYLSLNENDKALNYYLKAYYAKESTKAYFPHLLYRISICYQNAKQYEKALEFINEGLYLYSINVDFEYLKGLVYFNWKKYTLAIKSFNTCLELGDSASAFKFVNNCGSINPLISLGNLYYLLDDYENSLLYFTKALNLDNTLFSLMYKIGEILNKILEDKSLVAENLCKYFGSLEYLPNLILICDILIKEKLYTEAKIYIDKMNFFDGYEIDKYYLNGKLNFYTNNYDIALDYFNKVINEENSSQFTLPNIFNTTSHYILIIDLLNYDLTKTIDTNTLYKYNDKSTAEILNQFIAILSKSKEIYITNDYDNISGLNIVSEFLSKILSIKEIELFEKLLSVFNYFDNNSVFLSLAKIYYNCGYKEIAIKTIFRSIKELDTIDYDSINILYKEIR